MRQSWVLQAMTECEVGPLGLPQSLRPGPHEVPCAARTIVSRGVKTRQGWVCSARRGTSRETCERDFPQAAQADTGALLQRRGPAGTYPRQKRGRFRWGRIPGRGDGTCRCAQHRGLHGSSRHGVSRVRHEDGGDGASASSGAHVVHNSPRAPRQQQRLPGREPCARTCAPWPTGRFDDFDESCASRPNPRKSQSALYLCMAPKGNFLRFLR